jgi:hypothetical protein
MVLMGETLNAVCECAVKLALVEGRCLNHWAVGTRA